MSANHQSPTRRSVLKGAAWTAPVVVVATAAPARAASLPAVLNVVISSAGQQDSSLAATSTIANTSSGATTNLRVTATLSIVTGAFDPAFTPGASAPGYTVVSRANTSGNTATFVFDANSELAGNTTTAFNPLLGLVGQGPFSGTLLVRADPGVGTPGSSTRTFG